MNLKALLYIGAGIGILVCLWLWGESREEDGYNRAVAEHSELMAEWHDLQKLQYQEALAEERRRAVLLSDELSNLRGDYEALQSEVSHVEVVKPLPAGDLCAGYNPLGPDFTRLFNEGSRGGGDTKANADSGDGEVSRAPANGSR